MSIARNPPKSDIAPEERNVCLFIDLRLLPEPQGVVARSSYKHVAPPERKPLLVRRLNVFAISWRPNRKLAQVRATLRKSLTTLPN